jgi:DNA invertase Pin-like site-specific DNA recombinase
MRIAAYCRVSTDKDEQIDSLNHQKEFFVEYAKRNGHELFRLYADEGITGTSLKKREAFKQLLQDAELRLFDMVVVKDISRFARNTVDALQSGRKLKSMGINTLFLTANMDSMGDSEFILTLFSAMAQEESNNLSKRVKWGKKINAQKGRVPQRLFGYDRIDNFTLEINPDEAKIVRKIFDLYNEQGLGCRTISMTLNSDRDKTKYGSDWNARGVRRVLVNPIYCGILVNHKYEIEDFLTGKQVNIPKEEQFFHQRPAWAIVTPEDFQKAQATMNSRRTKYDSGESFREGRYSSKHIFSTLIKCQHCGRSFTRKTYTYVNTRVYWRCVTNDQYTAETCDNRIILDEPELTEELRKYFISMIEDKDIFVASILAVLNKQLPQAHDPEQAMQEFTFKRKRLLSKRERYREMYANDLISMTELKDKLAGIAEELTLIDSDLERFTQSPTAVGSPEKLVEQYRQEILRFLDLKTVTNVDMRRLIDHISVNKGGNVRVVLKKVGDIAQ